MFYATPKTLTCQAIITLGARGCCYCCCFLFVLFVCLFVVCVLLAKQAASPLTDSGFSAKKKKHPLDPFEIDKNLLSMDS